MPVDVIRQRNSHPLESLDSERAPLVDSLDSERAPLVEPDDFTIHPYNPPTRWQRIKNWFSEVFTWPKETVTVTQVENPALKAQKKSVIDILDGYISWWKLSWFGHHHNDRAKEVKKQVMQTSSSAQLYDILQSQKNVMVNATKPVAARHLDESEVRGRWFDSAAVKNRPKVVLIKSDRPFFKELAIRSTFLAAIKEALTKVDKESPSQVSTDTIRLAK